MMIKTFENRAQMVDYVVQSKALTDNRVKSFEYGWHADMGAWAVVLTYRQ